MANEEPDAVCSAEEPATESAANTETPPVGSDEYILWILALNRRRNKAAGGDKRNGH